MLIGESAPDDHGDPANRRFFYAEPLSSSDNLFRSVVAALYDSGKLSKDDAKEPWLQRLYEDGVYLIDLAVAPVNALTGSARRAALRNSVASCVQRSASLAPDGIIVCHTPSFRVLSEPLRAANLPLLHDEAIPFPLGNKRAEFVEKVRAAVAEDVDWAPALLASPSL